MAAGLDPAAFWDETPRSFVTIMEGTGRAAERRLERDFSLAWQTAALAGAAWAGKLKPIESYRNRGPRKQSSKEMLGTMCMLQDMGAPMTIRQIN